MTTKDRLQIYVDGKVTQSRPIGGPWLINTEPIVLGSRHENGKDEDYAWGIKGAVDEVMLYNRALNKNEVKHLYEMGL